MIGYGRQVGRDGVEVERDAAPPGSILNANITSFWLTMELLDIDHSACPGKILPVVFQVPSSPTPPYPYPFGGAPPSSSRLPTASLSFPFVHPRRLPA